MVVDVMLHDVLNDIGNHCIDLLALLPVNPVLDQNLSTSQQLSIRRDSRPGRTRLVPVLLPILSRHLSISLVSNHENWIPWVESSSMDPSSSASVSALKIIEDHRD